MPMSSFTTVFKFSRKTLQDIANSIDNPAPRFELSEKDRHSLATSGERFRNWLGKERLMMDRLTLRLGNADTSLW